MKTAEYIKCKTLLQAIVLILIAKRRMSKADKRYYRDRINSIASEIEYSDSTLNKNIEQAEDIILQLSR